MEKRFYHFAEKVGGKCRKGSTFFGERLEADSVGPGTAADALTGIVEWEQRQQEQIKNIKE